MNTDLYTAYVTYILKSYEPIWLALAIKAKWKLNATEASQC